MSEKIASLTKPRALLGLALIVLGVFLTLDNLGLMDLHVLFRHWPVVLVVLGIGRLRNSPAFGTSLIFAGAVLVARVYVDVDFDKLWPLLLLVLGAILVVRSFAGGGRRGRGLPAQEVGSEQLDVFVVLGSRRRQVTSGAFRGGSLTVIAGGCDVNLREAVLQGGEARLEVLAFWGGIHLRVPEDWNVSLQVTPVMGGVDDSRSRKHRALETDAGSRPAAGPHLVVSGFVLMGGIEVGL